MISSFRIYFGLFVDNKNTIWELNHGQVRRSLLTKLKFNILPPQTLQPRYSIKFSDTREDLDKLLDQKKIDKWQ